MLARKWELHHGFYDTRDAKPDREVFEEILRAKWDDGAELRIVKTLSTGQASGTYIQDEDEWVLVLKGEASLRLEGPEGPEVSLREGDALYLPATLWHEVTATSNPCVWLCLYWEVASTEDESETPELVEHALEFSQLLNLTTEQKRFFREGVLSLRMVLRLPYVHSLKGKRRIRQRVISGLEQDRRLSVREVSRQDSHKELYLSVASVVMNESEAQSLAQDIENTVLHKLADEGFIVGVEMDYL